MKGCWIPREIGTVGHYELGGELRLLFVSVICEVASRTEVANRTPAVHACLMLVRGHLGPLPEWAPSGGLQFAFDRM